ncbi:MAG: hypothetical protein AB4062_20790 [Crocosphaera sp.]
MTTPPLEALAQALKNAAPGPVALNGALIEGAGITPPTDLDAMLKAAFRLDETTPNLNLSFQSTNVGEVSNGQFQVKNVQLSDGFLGATVRETAAIATFRLPTTGLSIQ